DDGGAPLRAAARDCKRAANRSVRASGLSRNTRDSHARALAAGQGCDSTAPEITVQHRILPAEFLLLRADGRLEETGRLGHGPALAAPERQIREPDEVDHQRRGEHRIASLPRELHRHAHAEKSLEVDQVPRRLPVAERGDVGDLDARLGRIAEHAPDYAVLALPL